MHYSTVFDATHANGMASSLAPFIFIFLFLLFVAYRQNKRKPISTLRKRFFIGFSIFALVFLVGTTYGYHAQLINEAKSGATKIVEGKVESYTPYTMITKSESFCVQEVCFKYSPAITFDKPANWGGSIHQGLKVRITYFHENGSYPKDWRNNIILKLEVADESK